MKKLAIGIVILAIVLGSGLGVVGCSTKSGSTAQPTPEAAQAGEREGGKVMADGRVVPVRSAALSLPTGGVVAEVLVAEGNRVEAGQVLVKLEAARQRAAVAQAEAGLQRAQASLDGLKAGARPQEVEGAKAAVAAAQAQLAKIKQGSRPEEVAAAEAALAAAQASLQKVQKGPVENEMAAARAELANAEAALQQAQWAYDQVKWRGDIEMLPQSLRLQEATNNYKVAKARLDRLMNEPDEAAIANAKAQVQQAEAELNRLKAPARPADIAAAEAEVRRAQAQLDLLTAGARPEAVAAAEAEVGAAKATLEQAKAALAETELRAPFAGTVASVEVRAGEQVAPGAVIARLADLSVWQVETTDLTELSMVRIKEGDSVTITFDAVPGLELSGKVVHIKGIGESKQGDVTYTVVMKLDRQDERLRWNMTASVAIEPR